MSDDNVVDFDGYTTHDIDPDLVLENNKGEFERVLVIGWGKQGELLIASSFSSAPDIQWLIQRATRRLHEIADNEGFGG